MGTPGIVFLKDIYLEINTEKIAAIKNYNINILRDVYDIKSFCKKNVQKTLTYNTVFKIKLSKIKLLDKINLINLFELSDFNLSIVTPEYRLMFDNCNWTCVSEITPNNNLENHIIESVDIIATKKIQINNQDVLGK